MSYACHLLNPEISKGHSAASKRSLSKIKGSLKYQKGHLDIKTATSNIKGCVSFPCHLGAERDTLKNFGKTMDASNLADMMRAIHRPRLKIPDHAFTCGGKKNQPPDSKKHAQQQFTKK